MDSYEKFISDNKHEFDNKMLIDGEVFVRVKNDKCEFIDPNEITNIKPVTLKGK